MVDEIIVGMTRGNRIAAGKSGQAKLTASRMSSSTSRARPE
jgi:hypothetical protein